MCRHRMAHAPGKSAPVHCHSVDHTAHRFEALSCGEETLVASPQPSKSSMPKLAIFVYDLSATGVVRNALAIAGRLAADGWNVQVVTCKPGGALEDTRRSFDVVALDDRASRRSSRAFALARCILPLRRHLRASRPDILLSAGNHGHLICWAATRGLAQTKRVYRISNDLRHHIGSKASLRSMLRLASLHLLIRDAGHLVLVSPSLLEEQHLAEAVGRGNATVIRNGVANAEVRRQMIKPIDHSWFSEEVPIMLAVGRFAEQKNFVTLLHAMERANRKRRVRLVILGDGNHRRRAELVHLAERLNIADDVELCGVVGNPFPYLKQASAFVLPSLWEGSSNALLEALACGTPIVASRTAGNAVEILGNGRYGVLVDPLDTEQIAAAILQQIDDRQKVVSNNRANDFDREKSLDQYQLLFRSLASAG